MAVAHQAVGMQKGGAVGAARAGLGLVVEMQRPALDAQEGARVDAAAQEQAQQDADFAPLAERGGGFEQARGDAAEAQRLGREHAHRVRHAVPHHVARREQRLLVAFRPAVQALRVAAAQRGNQWPVSCSQACVTLAPPCRNPAAPITYARPCPSDRRPRRPC